MLDANNVPDILGHCLAAMCDATCDPTVRVSKPMRTCSILALLLIFGVCAGADSTIDPAHPYAYAANAGWVNFRPDSANGAVIGRYYCSNYLYAANVGWICLGSGTPANGVSYANDSAVDYGVNHDGLGNLRGYAWGANIGWLRFEDNGAPSVDLASGNLSGYVWSGNLGWISLSNAEAYVRTGVLDDGPDSDADDLPDAWEHSHTNVLDALSGLGGADSDGDGMTDVEECSADTDPLDEADLLRIVSFTVAGTTNSVAWSCRPTRFYLLETTNSLAGAGDWADAGLGVLAPPVTPTVTQTVTEVAENVRYYRVRAIVPLSP